MNAYFLYARKSTDVEDKQVLSIESQVNELREFAKRENLEIIEEFSEAKTAKEPGRPIFSYMLKQIEGGLAGVKKEPCHLNCSLTCGRVKKYNKNIPNKKGINIGHIFSSQLPTLKTCLIFSILLKPSIKK
jgi:hypothetical protein